MSRDLRLIANEIKNVRAALKDAAEEDLRLSTRIEALRERDEELQEQLLTAIAGGQHE